MSLMIVYLFLQSIIDGICRENRCLVNYALRAKGSPLRIGRSWRDSLRVQGIPHSRRSSSNNQSKTECLVWCRFWCRLAFRFSSRRCAVLWAFARTKADKP